MSTTDRIMRLLPALNDSNGPPTVARPHPATHARPSRLAGRAREISTGEHPAHERILNGAAGTQVDVAVVVEAHEHVAAPPRPGQRAGAPRDGGAGRRAPTPTARRRERSGTPPVLKCGPPAMPASVKRRRSVPSMA